MLHATRRTPVLIGLAVAAAVTSPTSVHAQIPPGYEVIRLTDDPDLDGPPAINNLGHVVWSKRIDQGFDTEEIFVWDGVEVRRITNDNVRDAFPDINDNGTIVWSRAKAPGDLENFEIVIWADDVMEVITDDNLGDWAPRINNLDHVAWGKHQARGCTEFDIFFYDGRLVRQVTSNGFSNQSPDINDFDELAWTRYDFCQNPWRATIMLYSGGEQFEISDGKGADQGATINNRMQIAWSNGFPDPNGVMLWADGTTEQIIESGRSPSLNDPGAIAYIRWHEDIAAFQQWLLNEGRCLRLSNDPVRNLNGSINNCGEVAWRSGDSPEADIILMGAIRGDGNHDGHVNLADAAFLDNCLRGPLIETQGCECSALDFDRNGTVDLRDFTGFQIQFGR